MKLAKNKYLEGEAQRNKVNQKLQEVAEDYSFSRDRAGMLERRRKGFGSTDHSAFRGLHPFVAPLRAYMDKVDPPEDSAKLIMEVGTYMESFIRSQFYKRHMERTGKFGPIWPVMPGMEKEYVNDGWGLIPHATKPFLFTNIDDACHDEFGFGVVEIKNVGAFTARKWKGDGYPHYNWVQCQHHMAVLSSHFPENPEYFDHCYLVGLLDNRELAVRLITRDDEFIKESLEILELQWEKVQSRDMEHFLTYEGSEDELKAIQKVFPGDVEAEPVDLSLDTETAIIEYLWHKDELATVKKQVEGFKAQIAMAMKESTRGTVNDYTVRYPVISGRKKVNIEAVKKDHPEINWDDYTTAGKDYRGGITIKRGKS